MELRDALGQIAEIRQQMARAELFRGYRAATVGASGLSALAAAAVQPWVVRPESRLPDFLVLWIGVAGLNLMMAGVQLWRRVRTGSDRTMASDGRASSSLPHARPVYSGLARQATLLAVEQFVPCLFVGAVLTLSIAYVAPDAAWMLPGLWALVYSLGIFASYRLLPRQTAWVGLYYVAAGAASLAWGRGANEPAAWPMALSFGGGQLFGAAVLYWTLERSDGTRE